jgi:hypothetical protein
MAVISISIRAPSGSAATPSVVRAGRVERTNLTLKGKTLATNVVTLRVT